MSAWVAVDWGGGGGGNKEGREWARITEVKVKADSLLLLYVSNLWRVKFAVNCF